MLKIINNVTRDCLAIVVNTLISVRRVARELSDLTGVRGAAKMTVSDNGLN